MAIDMQGFIDGTFTLYMCKLVTESDGDYDSDGIWQSGGEVISEFQANVQPHNPKEIEALDLGSERVTESIVVYPVDFFSFKLSPYMRIKVDMGAGERTYRIMQSDIRPQNNYAKITCNLIDK